MTYVERRISVMFTGPSTVTFDNLRASARVRIGGMPGLGTAELAIYGLTLSHINQLSTWGRTIHEHYDYWVTISAGDAINGMSQIFYGAVTQAWGDFQTAPDVPFHVVSQAGLIPNVQTSNQMWSSYSGPTDVVTMLKPLAAQCNLQLEDHGVKVTLDSPYFYGSPGVQIKQICDAAHIGSIIQDNNLAVWPSGSNRGDSGLTFAPGQGLVSYPTFTQYGILVKTEYAKPIKYGTTFTVQSDLQPATGKTWVAGLLDYDLQARMPNGHWFLTIGATIDGSFII